MSHDDPLVDLVLDAGQSGDDPADALAPEPSLWAPVDGVLRRWGWWATASRAGRALAAALALLLAVTVVAGGLALRPRPVRRVVSTVSPGGVTLAVDATGCPATRRCTVTAPPPDVLAAVLRHLSGGSILAATQTVDAASGRVYRREIEAGSALLTVRVVSACVDHSMPFRVAGGSTELPGAFHPLSAPSRWLLVPGTGGCSIFAENDQNLDVTLDDGAGGDALNVALTGEPALELAP